MILEGHTFFRRQSDMLGSAGDVHRFAVLDGWRACSILLVLAGHLLPIGPKIMGLNGAAATSGMVIFFVLSGFLITNMLSDDQDIRRFLIRRIFRIVPLAWAAMLVALVMAKAEADVYFRHFLFLANLPPQSLVPASSHLWSLCVEMHFYLAIALLVGLVGRKGLYLLPFLCLVVTAARIVDGAYTDIVTWRRVDEILAGATLALGYKGWFGEWPERLLKRVNLYLMLPILIASAHSAFGLLNYARPYVALITVGASLYHCPPMLANVFRSTYANYIAQISYALYVVHGILANSWLGSGDTLEKYAKRPVLIGLTFFLAHLSTRYFEAPFMRFARKISQR